MKTALVETKDVPEIVIAPGSGEASSTVNLKPQTDGRVVRIHFVEGDVVKEGDLLFSLDPRPFELAVRQEEADLARDAAMAKNAEAVVRRLENLKKDSFVSEDEYEVGLTRAASLQATVKAEEAAVEAAKIRLQYASIRSPLDGRIGATQVYPGDVVKENDTLLAVLRRLQPALVRFSVPQRYLDDIRRYQSQAPLKVEAVSPEDRTVKATGRLTFLDNSVDEPAGTILLKGLFPNTDEKLWPGQLVEARLTLNVLKDVLVAPAHAFQEGQDGWYGFVVKPDLTVDYRRVVLTRTGSLEVVVAKGLSAGEVVVVDGQIRLMNGSRVDIQDGPKPGAPPSPPLPAGAGSKLGSAGP